MINKHNINKVLNKLPKDKVELEKVQLSVASNIKKAEAQLDKLVEAENNIFKEAAAMDKEMAKIVKEIQKVETKRNKLLDKAEAVEKKYDDVYDFADENLEKAERAAKELEIKPSAIAGYDRAKALLTNIGTVSPSRIFEFDNPYF